MKNKLKESRKLIGKFVVPLNMPGSILKVSDTLEIFDYEYNGIRHEGVRSIIQKPYACWGLGTLIKITVFNAKKKKWAKKYTRKDVLRNSNELELDVIISDKAKGTGGHCINETDGKWWGVYGCHLVRPKGTKSFKRSIDVHRSMILNPRSHKVGMFPEPYKKYDEINVLDIKSDNKLNTWSSVRNILNDYISKFK